MEEVGKLLEKIGMILFFDDIKDVPYIINPRSPVGFPAPHHWLYGLLLIVAGSLLQLKSYVENYKYKIILERWLHEKM